MSTIGAVRLGVITLPEKIVPPPCWRCGQARLTARPQPGICNDCRYTTKRLSPAEQERLDAEIAEELGLEVAA